MHLELNVLESREAPGVKVYIYLVHVIVPFTR